MPKCDICSVEVGNIQAFMVDPTVFLSTFSRGFVPSRLGGRVGELGALMGLSRDAMWRNAVMGNIVEKWALCPFCNHEIEEAKTLPVLERYRYTKKWWQFWK